MKKINFPYIIGWKLRWNFKELYHKPVIISWVLDSSLITPHELDDYRNWEGDKWDKMYTKMVDFIDPENMPKIYIWSSLKIILESNWYFNYEWPIRIYWVFWIRPTTKTHIGQISKADILDKEWNVLKTIENINHN